MKYIAILLMFASSLQAATNTAASASAADVNTAIAAAASGDTILIPAGTVTWSTRVSVSGKKLVLKGAGIGQTKVTDNVAGGCFQANVTLANMVVIIGIEFTASANHPTSGMLNFDGPTSAAQGDQVAFRVAYCKFNWSSAVTRGIESVNCYGVIDHNYFANGASSGSVQSISPWGSSDSNDGGYTPWTRALSLGTTNCVCIEDNTFDYNVLDVATEDAIDGYGGARIVVRYNTFTNSSQGFHGTDSGNRRSTFSFEIYGNNYINNGAKGLRAATIRGGTGVVWGNTYGGTGVAWDGVVLMYYRACDNGVNHLDRSAWGVCDGTVWELGSASLSAQGSRTCSTTGNIRFCSGDNGTLGTEGAACTGGTFSLAFDGNDPHGYPGRDQPGRTTAQALDPVYVWSNGSFIAGIYDGGDTPPTTGGLAYYIAEGRDYTNNVTRAGYTALSYPHPLIVAQDGSPGNPTSGGTTRKITSKIRLHR